MLFGLVRVHDDAPRGLGASQPYSDLTEISVEKVRKFFATINEPAKPDSSSAKVVLRYPVLPKKLSELSGRIAIFVDSGWMTMLVLDEVYPDTVVFGTSWHKCGTMLYHGLPSPSP